MARRRIEHEAHALTLPKALQDIVPRAPDVAALARAHTAAAVDALVALLAADDERLRVGAAKALLDRGWGRPGQPSEALRPFAHLSDEQLMQAIEQLRTVITPAKVARRGRKS